MFKFAHVADLHLDTPFSGLGSLDAAAAEKLRDASLAAWDNVVRDCIERDVAFVVIAGDVYDGLDAGVRAQIRFLRGLERLSAVGIECFLVHGNHDPAGSLRALVGRWPERVHVFSCGRVEERVVERDGRVLAVVSGVSYRDQHVTDNLALGFARSELDAFHVGVLHCSVGDHPEHGRYAPCSLDDLVAARLDYWALGHIHARRVLREANPVVAYSGNTQGRHPKEEGAKGFLVVTVDDSRAASLEFVPTDLWRFASLEVDVSGIATLPELEERLAQLAREATAGAGGRGLVLRARLSGRGPLHASLARRGTLDGLLEHLRDEARSGGEDLWWDAVEDATRPALDRERLAAGDDFVADLIATADAWRAGPEARLARALEGLRGHAAVRRALDALGPDALALDAAAILEEAEALALDRLEVGAAPDRREVAAAPDRQEAGGAA